MGIPFLTAPLQVSLFFPLLPVPPLCPAAPCPRLPLRLPPPVSPPAPRSPSPRAAPSLRSPFRPRLLCSLFLALASLSVPARASESAELRQQALAQPALGSSVASVSGGFPAPPLPQVRAGAARECRAPTETEVLAEAPRRPLEGSGLQRQRLQGTLPPLTLSHLLILGNKPVLSKQNSLLQMRVKQLLILASMAFTLFGSEEPSGPVSLVVVAYGERCQT